MRTMRSVYLTAVLRKPIFWAAVALMASSSMLATQVLALETVVVIGDGRWRDCSVSGGIPYGDAAGNYGGCSYGGVGGGESPINPLPPGQGGGGGGSTPPDLVDRDISAALECAWDKYSHSNVRLTGGRTTKKDNAWACGTPDADNNWVSDCRSINVPP